MTGSRRLFWAGQIVGVAIIAIGIRGLLDERLGEPVSFARFFLGGAIAHDLILAPLVFSPTDTRPAEYNRGVQESMAGSFFSVSAISVRLSMVLYNVGRSK